MKRILFATVAFSAIALMGCEQSLVDVNAPETVTSSPIAATANAKKGAPASASTFTSHHPSQQVGCQLVDNAISRIPRGDGDGFVTDDETGPGGWRFSSGGGSFVTFNYLWNGGADAYDAVAGRSASGGNAVNDYPVNLNLPQSPDEGRRTFGRQHGTIALVGGELFQLPGQGTGSVRINLHLSGTEGGERFYEGCARTPQLTNFGFTVKEGGPFVEQEYFKAWARTDGDGNVLEYEWTEISTFNNTDPNAN